MSSVPPLVECVPNFSEGRDPVAIRQITDAIEAVDGVRLLDVDPGKATHRTVVTFVGPPDAVAEAAFQAIRVAADVIDMRRHHGEHPRMGATDVCPLVPVAGIAMDAVVALARALGRRIAAVFARFDAEPVASASIAQVHFATLKDGREVAVKVLRPGMLKVIEQDLQLIRMMATWVERLSADGKRLKPREVVAEFDKYLHDELDLMREAASAAQLRRNMAGLNLVLIPEMIWELARPDVLVMERMQGIPISQVERLREAGVDIPRLARDGVTIFFTQVFRDGFFHADMHPGNIMVSVDPATFGRYISLDFGIVGTLTEVDKEYLAQNFTAFFRRDYKRVAELHIESGWVPAGTRVDELESAVRSVCEPYFDRPLKDISLGKVLLRLFQTSRRFNVEIQPQLVLLQKTLLNIEGLGRQLDPELDLWSTAKPFLEKWMVEQVGPQKLLAEFKAQAPRYAKLLPELPRLLHDYLRRGPEERERELQELLREQRRTNKLLQALLYGGLGFVLGLVVMQLILRVRLASPF